MVIKNDPQATDPIW